jgi:3-methylcrotonyl-CoA carboxylase alpha subunit
MKWLVNGVETEIEPAGDATVEQVGDRLVVRGASGRATGLAVRRGDQVHISFKGRQYILEKPRAASGGPEAAKGDAKAPMPGSIVEVFVSEGDVVVTGQKLLILEAMKMQQEVLAPFDGVVEKIPVAKGDQVSEGQLLVHVEPTA